MHAILLVDDDRDLCALLQRALEAAGYSVRCCLTGHEGVRALAATPCQLVVLDVMLPDMDGFAVVQQIRSRSTVPILMLTAREDSASKVRGLQLGADDYLSKPFEMEELLARVAALIRRYTRLNTADVQHKLVFDGLVIDLDARCVLRNGEPVELLAKDLKELISKTTFCCAQDDSRPVLKGCLIKTEEGRVSFTALDGYRMATCKKNIVAMSGDIRIICPGRTLNEIGRMLGGDDETIEIFVQKNMLMVSIDDTVLTSRLYEGEFVNVSNIVPREFASEVVVEKNLLGESVERAAVLARTDKNSIIMFDIREDAMNVTSNTTIGRVDESVKIMLEGKDVQIALNCKYVSECLNAVSDEKVRIGFNGPVSPCVVTPVEGDSYLYLILPVRTTA